MIQRTRVALIMICLFALAVVSAACVGIQSEEAVSSGPVDTAQEEMAQEEMESHSEDEDAHDEDDHDHDEDEDDHAHDEENDSAERRDNDAHEHGAATLTLAWSGNEMEVELDSPAYNFFGFEYEPSTDDEKQVVADSLAVLEAGDFLAFNADADCTIDVVDVSSAWDSDHADDDHKDDDHADDDHADDDHADDDHADDDHADDDHSDEEHADDEHDDHEHSDDEEVHSDVEVAYTLICRNSDAIESLDLSALFGRFPNMTDLDVQWISDTMQSSAEAMPDSPVVTLQ